MGEGWMPPNNGLFDFEDTSMEESQDLSRSASKPQASEGKLDDGQSSGSKSRICQACGGRHTVGKMGKPGTDFARKWFCACCWTKWDEHHENENLAAYVSKWKCESCNFFRAWGSFEDAGSGFSGRWICEYCRTAREQENLYESQLVGAESESSIQNTPCASGGRELREDAVSRTPQRQGAQVWVDISIGDLEDEGDGLMRWYASPHQVFNDISTGDKEDESSELSQLYMTPCRWTSDLSTGHEEDAGLESKQSYNFQADLPSFPVVCG